MNYINSIRESRDARNQALFAGCSVVSVVTAAVVTVTVAQGFLHGLLVFVITWFYMLLALALLVGTIVFITDLYNDYKNNNDGK